MWTTEYTLTTDVAPQALWQLLSDVNSWGEWNEGIDTIALQGPLTVGATFLMKPPGEDALSSTIAELEEGTAISADLPQVMAALVAHVGLEKRG